MGYEGNVKGIERNVELEMIVVTILRSLGYMTKTKDIGWTTTGLESAKWHVCTDPKTRKSMVKKSRHERPFHAERFACFHWLFLPFQTN